MDISDTSRLIPRILADPQVDPLGAPFRPPENLLGEPLLKDLTRGLPKAMDPVRVNMDPMGPLDFKKRLSITFSMSFEHILTCFRGFWKIFLIFENRSFENFSKNFQKFQKYHFGLVPLFRSISMTLWPFSNIRSVKIVKNYPIEINKQL